MTLATFLHISDLHLSDEALVFPDRPSSVFSLRRHFNGLLGHSSGSLIRLYFFWEKHLRSENAYLIVTGDLTRVGKNAQFEMANKYLGSRLDPPIADYLGLGIGEGWPKMAIPGNHDHWPGLPIILGPPQSGLKKHFSHVPDVTNHPVSLGGGRKLRFLWINSDADIAWEGKSRLFAIGAFETQLRELETKLGVKKPDGSEIRVLCLHHSRESARRKRILGIKRASRLLLDKFIVEHDIAILLTGHVHDPLLDPFSLVTMTGEVLEARCGTTTQASNPPGLRRELNPWPNSLLVHRLSEEGGTFYWNTEVYIEDRSANDPTDGSGFMKANVLREKRRPEYRIKVWPRP
jgi:hypothetical protein